MKTLTFRPGLIPMIISGEKTFLWLLSDDKNLQAGDEIEFTNYLTKEVFGTGVITATKEKTLGTLDDKDWEGHEKFESEAEMYKHYRENYGDKVGPDSAVKLIDFEFKSNVIPALPTREEAQKLLEDHVKDEYQRRHALMVATAMGGYAKSFGEDEDLWYITGLLHDIDFDKYPDKHPGESLKWFRLWGYPEEMVHAVEAHAYGYNGFETEPKTKLASALIACDEISGIFYAYQKLNPVPFGEMKVKSIEKRLAEKTFAAKIDRSTIYRGCEGLEITLEDHIANLIKFFSSLD